MDEHWSSALQYGHLGRAIYYSETQTWGFARRLSPPPHISYEGVTTTTVPSPLTAPQSSLVENKHALRRVYPELAACWPLLGNETLSHVIATTSERCDPLVSSLLDFGYAVDLETDEWRNRVVPIAVVASGECGNSVSFRMIEEDIVEVRQENTIGMRVPSIGNSERVEWCAGGAPVRQICFARPVEEKPTWLAVRFHRSTSIFRPMYHRTPVPVHIYRQGERVPPNSHSNSRLNANPLVEISHLQTGGFAHADVTFNPWYQRQFALVDERGNWSIWEISGRQRRHKSNLSAVCVKSGSLPWLDLGDDQDIEGHPRHDGWAAIEWVGDFKTLIVSDRRCLILYRTEDDDTYSYPIELDLGRRSEWILDMKRSPCNVSHVFILTTSRIFLLDVSPESLPVADKASSPSLYPRLSWRHFRDPEDTTLKLTPLIVHTDFFLVLYSRLNNIVLSFHCSTTAGDIVSIPDPFILDIPSISDDDIELQAGSDSAQFSSLVFKEISHLPTFVSRDYYNPDQKLVKLFAVDTQLRVREYIFSGPAYGGTEDEGDLGDHVLRPKKRQAGVRKEQYVRPKDEFVVDDWDDSVVGAGAFAVANTGVSSITPLAIPQWTMDFTQVYAVATGRMIVASSEGQEAPTIDKSLRESIQELRSKVSNLNLSEQPVGRTMLEYLGSSPLLDDIDQNAQEISEYLSEFIPDGHSQRFFVQLPAESDAAPPLTGTSSTTGVNLIDLYDRLANDWLASLPHDIPGRTRIMKEKVIRTIAADIVLSQVTVLRSTKHGIGEPPAKTLETSTNEGNIDEDGIPNETQSSQLPLPPNTPWHRTKVPSNSATVRNDTGRGEEGLRETKDDTVPLFSNLASFTKFNTDRPLPRNVANMLQQWQPGTDPSGYTWQRIGQASETDDGLVSNPTTPKRRLRKKTPQTTNFDSSAPPLISSATPVVRDWGSQPDRNERFASRPPLSSQLFDEDLPMTQVERGIFGGREAARKNAAKARKKRRAAGF
ncbi:RNA polymerase I-specific transcription initiation factor RRN6-like protein [Aspergillus floccosus]